jgi:hypothetical protein
MRERERIYIVMHLRSRIRVKINNSVHESELKWDKGMVGVAPIFKTKEDAEKAYPGFTVEELEYDPELLEHKQ